MINVAILEDEESQSEAIISCLKNFFGKKSIEIHFDLFPNCSSFLNANNTVYDINILDVKLPDGNGIDVAKIIRSKGNNSVIIFVTNMRQFALKGYEVAALNYLIKPLQPLLFDETMERALANIAINKSSTILIKTKDGSYHIDVKDIEAVEVFSHEISLITKEEEYITCGTLKHFAELLPNSYFIQINSYVLININAISKMQNNSIQLFSGRKYEISRRRKKEFILAINNYFGGIV